MWLSELPRYNTLDQIMGFEPSNYPFFGFVTPPLLVFFLYLGKIRDIVLRKYNFAYNTANERASIVSFR